MFRLNSRETRGVTDNLHVRAVKLHSQVVNDLMDIYRPKEQSDMLQNRQATNNFQLLEISPVSASAVKVPAVSASNRGQERPWES